MPHRGRLEDGGVLADRDLVAPGVLQGLGEVECLVAVAVVLPLAAGEEEDPGPAGGLLLGQGRSGQAAEYHETEEQTIRIDPRSGSWTSGTGRTSTAGSGES